jgi:capsular polysaccharide biosynthesis protein
MLKIIMEIIQSIANGLIISFALIFFKKLYDRDKKK